MLTKTFVPQVKGIDSSDGSGQLVVASLGEIDLDGDVTLPGFFGRQPVALVPAHDHQHVPIGKGVLYEAGSSAVVDFRLNLKVRAARDWFEAIKFDFEHPPALQEYSYGFNLKEGGYRRGTHNGQSVRFLQPLASGLPGARVFEVSPVMQGAGIGTRTVSLGAAEDQAAVEAFANEMVRNIEITNGKQYDSPEEMWANEVARTVAISRGLV